MACAPSGTIRGGLCEVPQAVIRMVDNSKVNNILVILKMDIGMAKVFS